MNGCAYRIPVERASESPRSPCLRRPAVAAHSHFDRVIGWMPSSSAVCFCCLPARTNATSLARNSAGSARGAWSRAFCEGCDLATETGTFLVGQVNLSPERASAPRIRRRHRGSTIGRRHDTRVTTRQTYEEHLPLLVSIAHDEPSAALALDATSAAATNSSRGAWWSVL